jgi:hypothetical protein
VGEAIQTEMKKINADQMILDQGKIGLHLQLAEIIGRK